VDLSTALGISIFSELLAHFLVHAWLMQPALMQVIPGCHSGHMPTVTSHRLFGHGPSFWGSKEFCFMDEHWPIPHSPRPENGPWLVFISQSR